jgi:hypothetical protein
MKWFYSSNKKKLFIPVVDILGAVDERRGVVGMLDVTLSLSTRRGDTWPKKRCLFYLPKKCQNMKKSLQTSFTIIGMWIILMFNFRGIIMIHNLF